MKLKIIALCDTISSISLSGVEEFVIKFCLKDMFRDAIK